MSRVHVLAEGQTEETFIRDVLAPYLATKGVYPFATLVKTKRVKDGPDFKGGITSYRQVKNDITLLLRDTNAVAVTTMIDFYGLPSGFPRGAQPRPPATRTAGSSMSNQSSDAIYPIRDSSRSLCSTSLRH